MIADGLTLEDADACCFGIMYTTINTAHGRFPCSGEKRIKSTWLLSERNFGLVSKSKIISQPGSKNCCCRIGNYRMPAGEFRKRGCLDKRLPTRVNELVDDR